MADPRISVVLPVYNEDQNIATCLRRLYAALAEHEHEILVCYDFDEDTTLGAIERMDDAPPTLRLVKNDFGRGAANALRAGFAAATGDVVVTTMADLSDPPEVIPTLAAKMRETGASVISGSRYMPGGSQSGGPWLKGMMSWGAGLSLKWLAGIPTHDSTNNFRAYDPEFLKKVEIESNHAFDIALELTVKAHRMGYQVSEVPSSWTDRSDGESRFLLWKWLPQYLRWYWKAMTVPTAVWGLLLVLTVIGLVRPGFTGGTTGADHAVTLAMSAVGALWVLASRRMRGRMTWLDLAFPALWAHPWHVEWWRAGHFWQSFGGTVAASVLVLLIGSGPRKFVDGMGRALGWFTQGRVGLIVIAALLWLSRLHIPQVEEGVGLDPSWRRAFGHFFVNGFQAGVDYTYTYGPLGVMTHGAYHPDVFWTKMVVWEFGVKVAVVVILLLASLRLRGTFDKTLFWLLLMMLPLDADPYFYAAIASVGFVLMTGPRVSFPLVALGFFVLVALSLGKFTSLVMSTFTVGCVVLSIWKRRSLPAAAAAAAMFVIFFLTGWMLCRQSPLNLPQFVSNAGSVASGYSEAMFRLSDMTTLIMGAVTLALIGLMLAACVLPRPWTPTRWLLAAVIAFATFVAFKAGYTRQQGSITFYGFAVIAAILTIPPPTAGLVLDRSVTVLRYAVILLSMVAIYRAVPARTPLRLPGMWSRGLEFNYRGVTDLSTVHQRRTVENRGAMRRNTLHLTRKVVGDGSIDLLGSHQSYLLLNELNWRPRPMFQSYSAYTKQLLELNRDFFLSDRAPDFVLMRLEQRDHTLMVQNDTLALQVVLRDYDARLIESNLILFKRREDGVPTPPPQREVVLEKTIELGEEVDLTGLPGECHVVYLDIQYNLLGKVAKSLLYPPLYELNVTTDEGNVYSPRIVPGVWREGVILDPFVYDNQGFAKWLGRLPIERPVKLELKDGSTKRRLSRPGIHLKVERADDLVPRPIKISVAEAPTYPMFASVPTKVEARGAATPSRLDGKPALLVGAPSEMVFDVKGEGPYRLSGWYGIAGHAQDATDGVLFSVTVRDTSGLETSVFERYLNPRGSIHDRGAQTLEVEVTVPVEQVILRTANGEDIGADHAMWAGIDIAPVQDDE